MLASGGDDSLVLVWDLLHSNNGAVVPNGGVTGDIGVLPSPSTMSTTTSNSTTGQSSTGVAAAGANVKGPAASWKCEYEVANLSWAPPSGLTAQGGEWVGVAGGRGVWGVKL
jgi:WD repeat-containing protein 68